jgi:hypothetical protein
VSGVPQDPQLFKLFCDALAVALEYVRYAEASGSYIETLSNWPELDGYECDFPLVSTARHGPKDYSTVIHGFGGLFPLLDDPNQSPRNFGDEPSVRALIDYAKSQKRLQEFLMFDESGDQAESILRQFVGEVLDRYIQVYNTRDHDNAKLLKIYLPIETYLLNETLLYQALVPLLLLKFEMPQIPITETVSVEKIPDDIHLARSWAGKWPLRATSHVPELATHALRVANRTLKNETWWALRQTEDDKTLTETIDIFFAAVRIATGYATGYAQVLTFPLGWAFAYAGNLTPLRARSVNGYPPYFEDGDWREEAPTVDASKASLIGATFKQLILALQGEHSRKATLAMHRLNLSGMRTTDEDGLIDVMIAVEALLSSGDDRQEITHKISMRLAALHKLTRLRPPTEVLSEMKKIYTFRSKIVHGDPDAYKYAELNRGARKVSTFDAALEHLRTAFFVLITNPELLDPKKIDHYLLTDVIRPGEPSDVP